MARWLRGNGRRRRYGGRVALDTPACRAACCGGGGCNPNAYRVAFHAPDASDCTEVPTWILVPDCTTCAEVCIGVCWTVTQGTPFVRRPPDCPSWVVLAEEDFTLTKGPVGVPVRRSVAWDAGTAYAQGDAVLVQDGSVWRGWIATRAIAAGGSAPAYDPTPPFFGGSPEADWFYLGEADASCLAPPVGEFYFVPPGATVFESADMPDDCGCLGCDQGGAFVPTRPCPGATMPTIPISCAAFWDMVAAGNGPGPTRIYRNDIGGGASGACFQGWKWTPGASPGAINFTPLVGSCCGCDSDCVEYQDGECCCEVGQGVTVADVSGVEVEWSLDALDRRITNINEVRWNGTACEYRTRTYIEDTPTGDTGWGPTYLGSASPNLGNEFCGWNCGDGGGDTNELAPPIYYDREIEGGGCTCLQRAWFQAYTPGGNFVAGTYRACWTLDQNDCTALTPGNLLPVGALRSGPQLAPLDEDRIFADLGIRMEEA